MRVTGLWSRLCAFDAWCLVSVVTACCAHANAGSMIALSGCAYPVGCRAAGYVVLLNTALDC